MQNTSPTSICTNNSPTTIIALSFEIIMRVEPSYTDCPNTKAAKAEPEATAPDQQFVKTWSQSLELVEDLYIISSSGSTTSSGSSSSDVLVSKLQFSC